MKFLLLILSSCSVFLQGYSQNDDNEGPYRGKYLGKLNSYHHQVSGHVYAVDEYTLLLTSFNYDGGAKDAFFWVGTTIRPGPQGFIVPDDYGRTNVLRSYLNKDFTLVLPDKKKLTEIKWFAIYDLWSQNNFGDVYIPEGFEPPAIQKLTPLIGRSHDVSSGDIEILDSKRIKINALKYDGKALKAQFWVGTGAEPSTKGTKVPDEYGYLDPLRAYDGNNIILEIPGDLTIFNINWFSIFDHETKQDLGSIIIPSRLNVPPSLVKIIPHEDKLKNCYQLHKDLQVSWEIFGPAITIRLIGQVEKDEYMAFGISGSQEKSQMMGADVAVAYIHGYRGFANDYNITALTTCVKVLGQFRGACKDDVVGGQDNNQVHTAVRENGLNIITYRRDLISPDHGDKEFLTEAPTYIVWAIGRLDKNMEPAFHDIYPKTNISILLNSKEPTSNCFSFTRSNSEVIEPWKQNHIRGIAMRVFNAYIGPSGGKKGYQGLTGQTSTSLAWYINGMLAPELWLRRGLSYAFKVYGGNNPHSAEYYHPLIITDEPYGGFDRLNDEKQSKVRVLAGVEYTRRGRPRPTTTGPLCLAKHKDTEDRRLDDNYLTFKKFNRSLVYSCEDGEGGTLEFTPNNSWPDTVYYNSFTQGNMGWKIHIIDSFNGASLLAFSPTLFTFIVACDLLFLYKLIL